MRAHTGDVGLCAMLQPNDDAARARIPTAVCVITAKFASGKHFHDIRELQAKYLVKQIDEFNQSFQLPIIVGLSASAAPDSNVMHILESGFVQNRPLLPSAPISEPVVSNASLSSVYIEWEEAPDEGDAPVVFYRIERRAGTQHRHMSPLLPPAPPFIALTALALACLDHHDVTMCLAGCLRPMLTMYYGMAWWSHR